MKAVISVANVAAGVGKTTTAIHLAAELALRGYDTVLIDADPQAEATARLVEPEAVRLSLADVLFETERSRALPGERPVSLAEVLTPTSLPSLHLVPSNIKLAAGFPVSPYGLNERLMSLGRACDFAIIDTPPSLGPLAALCLSASTHLLAPVSPCGQGGQGLDLLIENLWRLCRQGGVRWLGVVCNLFDCGSHSSGEFYEGLKREWRGQAFEAIVHRDDLIAGCGARRLPVQVLAPQSTAAAVYSQVADEVLGRLRVAPHIGRPNLRLAQA